MSQELNGTLTNSANLVGTFGTNGGSGTNNYNDLTNKPQINGVELQGNKTTSNLNISYNDITNKPTINGVMLQGNKTTSNLNISYNDLKNKPTLSTVATSGSYNDLSNKPTIPSKTSDLTNDSNFVTSSELATVATTGSYNDLTNTPTIPAAQVNSDWNSSSGVSEILNKPTLAAVATSGSYNDLTDTPTIPVNSDFALSGLSDTDITTPTANQVLAYDGDNWVNSSALEWKSAGNIYELGTVGNGTWTLSQDISDCNELLLNWIFDTNKARPRASLVIPKSKFVGVADGIFPTFTLGSTLIYVELYYATATTITVANFSNNAGSARLELFYR